MQIIPFDESHIPAAANMLHDNIQDLGRGVPGLPQGLENTEKMKSLLGSVLKRSAGLAAVQGEITLGFLVFDRGGGEEFNFFKSEASVHITGAYIRPEYRRQGLATRILERALRHYAADGLESMTVDFEAFNPEASGFWMKHFHATAYSLIRVPENTLLGSE